MRWVEQIERMVDYWWPMRDKRNLLLIESRSPVEDTHFYQTNAPGQTPSLAVSLLESTALIYAKQPLLAYTMRRRAEAHIDGFLMLHMICRRAYL